MAPGHKIAIFMCGGGEDVWDVRLFYSRGDLSVSQGGQLSLEALESPGIALELEHALEIALESPGIAVEPLKIIYKLQLYLIKGGIETLGINIHVFSVTQRACN